ncbi:hypothetical protein ACH3XW_13930 [Acanthocheilonema viteae]
MDVANEGWKFMITLPFLSLIPFVALFIFLAIYFGRSKRAQIMEQQNAIASFDQQNHMRNDKKKESLVNNTQSTQKSVDCTTTTVSRVKHCDIETDTDAINVKRNRILEDVPSEIINTSMEKNDSSVQLQSLHISTNQNAPEIPPTIVTEGEEIERDITGNQPLYQITKSAQKIVNVFSHELVSSHPMSNHRSSQPTRNSTEENSECTEFTIPEFQTNISKSLMTEEC